MRSSESITFQSMETYLKCLYPSLNDVFILTLFICNSLTIFEICLIQGSFVKRIVMLLYCAIKYNIVLILLWMGLLTLFQIPFIANLVPYGLRLIRLFGSTDTMTFIRADVKFYCQHLLLVELSLGLYLLFLGMWFYKERSEEEADQEWNFAQFRTLEHLFYPLHPRSLSHLNGNAFLEWNQQEIPSLWMAAHMSSDYIKLLPTWSYINRDQSTECAGSNTQPAYSTTNNRTEQDHPPIQSDNGTPSQCYIITERCPPAQTHPLCVWDFVECSQCVICLEDYEEGVLLCGLPCKHSFHQRCIVVWLQRDNHYCPVCRWPSNKAMPVHVHSE